MKKNVGRKERRFQYFKAVRQKGNVVIKPKNEVKREPHENAIAAQELRNAKTEQAVEQWEFFLNSLKKETKLGKEMLAEQKERLQRRHKWQKRLGIA